MNYGLEGYQEELSRWLKPIPVSFITHSCDRSAMIYINKNRKKRCNYNFSNRSQYQPSKACNVSSLVLKLLDEIWMFDCGEGTHFVRRRDSSLQKD